MDSFNNLLYSAGNDNLETFSNNFKTSGTPINGSDDKKRTMIQQASILENIDVMKFLIKEGADIESPDEDNTSILGVVSSMGLEEVSKILLEAGAYVDHKDNRSYTPLNYASSGKHFGIVNLLVENGADLKVTDNNGYNYIQKAIMRCNHELVSILIKGGSDINVLNQENTLMDLLIYSSDSEEIDDVEKTILSLIENGYDINSKNPKGRSPLHTACMNENKDIIHILLQNGSNVYLEDKTGEHPIYYSIRSTFNVENVKQLIDAESDLEKVMEKDGFNMSYLNFSILMYCKEASDIKLDSKKTNFLEIIRLLCENCARLDSLKEESDQDFLDYIIELSFSKYKLSPDEIYPVVDILIENGLSMDKKNKNGHTRLIDFVIKGNFKYVRFLIGLKANINITDIRGVTAFTHAARGIKGSFEGSNSHRNIASLLARNNANGEEGYKMHPYLEKVRIDEYKNPELLPELHNKLQDGNEVRRLVNHGVNIDGIHDKKTPLTRACLMGLIETVEILINNGASVEKKDGEGNTPVMICSHNCKSQILKFLIRNGADVSSSGKNILLKACFNDDLETVKILIDAGIDIDGSDSKGYTSVHVAVLNDNIDLLTLLIENSAQLNIVDFSGKITPLMLASNENKKDMVKILTKNGAIIDENSLQLFEPAKTFTKEDLLATDESDDIFFGRCEHIDHVKLKDGRCVYMTTRDARKLMMLKLNSSIDTDRIILPIQSSQTCWFFTTIAILFVSDLSRKNTKVIRKTMITGRKVYSKFDEDLIKVLIRLNIIIETILNGNAADSRFVFPIINNEEVVTGLKRNNISQRGINCGGNSKNFSLSLSYELTLEDPIEEVKDISNIKVRKPIFIMELDKYMKTSIEILNKKYIADCITISYHGHVISGITLGGKRYIYDSNVGMIEMDWYQIFNNEDFEFVVNKKTYTVRLALIYAYYNIVE